MQNSLIISIINLIAIVILFILFFTKTKKENFTGAPSGYTNLLVSDSDGNLDTFSMDTLKTDIQTMIDDSLKSYMTSSNISKDYATKDDLTKNYIDVTKLRTALVNYQPKGSYVKIGDEIALQSKRDAGSGIYLYAEGGHDVNRRPCKTDPSKWPKTPCTWQVNSVSALD
jgi:flagellar basal body-associated protein FliL